MSESFELWNIEGDSEFSETVGLPSWTTRGACFAGGRGELLEDFFAEIDSTDMSTERVYGAKRRCVGCAVRTDCLTYALSNEHGHALEGDGIFGGCTPTQRNFASQAEDPVAFGLRVLDEEVTMGLVTTRVPRWKDEHVGLSGSL
jgi:hypothetical protein